MRSMPSENSPLDKVLPALWYLGIGVLFWIGCGSVSRRIQPYASCLWVNDHWSCTDPTDQVYDLNPNDEKLKGFILIDQTGFINLTEACH